MALFVSQAHADDQPKSDCKQPVVPAVDASPLVVKYFYKHMDEYKKCISKFVAEQQGIEKNTADTVKQTIAHNAAESAIKEFNDFMALANERNEKIKAGNDDDDDSSK